MPKRATNALKLSPRSMRKVERDLYEKSFYHFVKRAWREIVPDALEDNWHIRVLCLHLQAVAEGRILKLLINIAPRTGKSVIINQMFTAWLWTTRPEKRILALSHTEGLAIDNSTNARRLIESEWYQGHWPTKLRGDQNSKSSFANDKMGVRQCSPISSVTGRGANIVIVDDPHSVDDAKSVAKLKTGVDLFREAVSSRVNNPKKDAIIVVMQRLHQLDVSGYILDTPELGYDHLCIPYVADGVDRPRTKIGWKDPREEGELMAPSRFDDDFVASQKANLGPYGWSGQYQQNPVPAEDGFFDIEWFRRFEAGEITPQSKGYNFYMTSDHAPSGRGDFNCIRVWAVDSNRNVWLVDSFHKRCLMDEAFGLARDSSGRPVVGEEGALALIRKWKVLVWFPENDLSWTNNSQSVRAHMVHTGTHCVMRPIATKGSGDKMGKAQAYQAMAASGAVHIPNGKMGDETLEEYATFPLGKYDDRVDADGAIARIINEAVGGIAPPPPKPEYVDDWGPKPDAMADSDLCWG